MCVASLSGGVEVRSELDESALLALIGEKFLALRIPNFYPSELAREIGQRMITSHRFGHYVNASDIGRAGIAFYESVGADGKPDLRLRDRYYAEARSAMRELRRLCLPYGSPMDLLRLNLQEAGPAGATLENLEGRPMFVGLGRVFETGAEALPHQDILRRDAPDCKRAYSLKTQLAANVYLQTGVGGELEIWQQRCSDEEYQALRLTGSYGLDRAKLPSSALIIKPCIGDLILFDSTRVHAVRKVTNGPRIAFSCFVGFRGTDVPLSFWS